jgi:hypothetical protein
MRSFHDEAIRNNYERSVRKCHEEIELDQWGWGKGRDAGPATALGSGYPDARILSQSVVLEEAF